MRREKNVFLWCTVLYGIVISCSEPIELGSFERKGIEERTNNVIEVETARYKYRDKIEITWKKVREAANYFIYVLRKKTDTVGMGRLYFIAGANELTHTIPIKVRKGSDFTQTRYIVVVARDAQQEELFRSEMIEGKTLGKPIINEKEEERTFYRVSFAWSSVEGVSDYEVERRKKGEGVYKAVSSEVKGGGEGIWTMVDETVESGMEYEYRVRAKVREGGDVIAERVREFEVRTPEQDGPHEVRNVGVSKYVYTDRVLVVWDEPEELLGFRNDEVRYTIKRRDRKEKGDKRIGDFRVLARVMGTAMRKVSDIEAALHVRAVFKKSKLTSLVYEDKDVEVNKQYEYQIVAGYVDGDDNSERLGKPSEVYEGASIPRAENVEVSGSGEAVFLKWDVPSDFSGDTQVYRSKEGMPFEDITKKNNFVEQSSYLDEEIESNVFIRYEYKVRLVPLLPVRATGSKRAFTRGVFSDVVFYDVSATGAQVFDFSILEGKKDRLEFEWQVPEGVGSSDFWIEEQKDGGIFKEVVLSAGPAVDVENRVGHAEMTVGDPKSYNPTLYRLALKNNGVVTYSKVLLGDVLRAPRELGATGGESAEYIEVSWQPSLWAKKYKVELRKRGSAGWQGYEFEDGKDFMVPQNGNKGIQRVNITPLENDTPEERGGVYEIRVVAVGKDEAIDVVKSDTVEGNTFGPAGMNVRASRGSFKDKITVSWDAVAGAEGYVVLRKEEGGDEIEIAIVAAKAETSRYRYDDTLKEAQYIGASVPALEMKRKYEYKVLPTKKGLRTIASETSEGYVQVSVSPVTGVTASDVDYEKDEGMYIARQGGDVSEHNSKDDMYKIDRADGLSYATKVEWDAVLGADKYHVYRMDFNEKTNFWRKIGERSAKEQRVFFDIEALVLREYRALYWVVAFARGHDGTWKHDASFVKEGSAHVATHTEFAGLSFPRFNAAKQTRNIERMSEHTNVDVGSRWITPREYVNWSLSVIGDGVYIAYNEDSTSYGLGRDGWSYIVSFTMEDYSLGARANSISNRASRRGRKSTELVVNSNDGLNGSCYESSPNCDTGVWIGGYRAGFYVGNDRHMTVNSPYGNAFVKLSGTARKTYFGFAPTGISQTNGLYYNFASGTIRFAWDKFDVSKADKDVFKALEKVSFNGKKGFEFSKSQNIGAKGALNPYVTPIRFNREYNTFLEAVYGTR